MGLLDVARPRLCGPPGYCGAPVRADILQPDVGWCGGITELIKISALAVLIGEPVPVYGRMKLPDTPGFGFELNPDVELVRAVTR